MARLGTDPPHAPPAPSPHPLATTQGVSEADGKTYAVELELFGAIDQEQSKTSAGGRTVVVVLAKHSVGPHWPRLLKAPGKPPKHVKVDWNLFMDEDDELEEAEKAQFNLGDLDDFSKFDDPLDKDVHSDSSDSDDEDLDGLEKPF